MSGTGSAHNGYLHGGADGNPVGVTLGGNVSTQVLYGQMKNGRYVIRTNVATRLPDCPASFVEIYNKEGNHNIWFAGHTDHAPMVGVGIPILEGHSIKLPCSNSNQVSLIAENDGDEVYVNIANAGPDVPIPVSNPPPLDKIPPSIISVFPLNGATNVPRDVLINITANKAIDLGSVNINTVTMSPSMTGMTISLDSNNSSIIVITHSSLLDPTTTYTVTVTTSVTNFYGYALAAPFSFSFTTAALPPPPDTTPPTIVSSNPAQSAVSVHPNIIPSITFSEAMLNTSLTPSTISIVDTVGTILGGTTISQSADLKTASINGLSMAAFSSYTITVSTSVTDLAGNHLASSYVIPFSTGGTTETVMNVSGNIYESLYTPSFFSSSNIFSGLQVVNTASSLYNRKPVKYTFIVKKTGAPTGTASLLWYRLTGGTYSVFKTISTFNVATAVNTTDTTIVINDDTNNTTLAVGDLIGISYNSGSSSAYLMVKYSNTDAFDGANTVYTRITSASFGGTTVTPVTSSDLGITIDCKV